jgi:hypothetical protein
VSFADLRQTVLQSHALNPAFFAETVQIGSPDDPDNLLNVVAKCEDVPQWMNRGTDGQNETRRGTFDQREWLRVTLSRDATKPNSYPGRPQPATPLYRSEARDADRRPFTFRNNIVYEGDQHAVYIFERPRRVGQGKGAGA